MWKVISLSSSTLRQGLRFHTMSASINWWTSIPSRQAIMAHCAGSRRRVMPADGTQLHLTGVARIFSQWVRNNSVIASHLQKLPYFAAYGLLLISARQHMLSALYAIARVRRQRRRQLAWYGATLFILLPSPPLPPFPLPSLFTLSLPSPSVLFPPLLTLPLEVGFLNPARGPGERCTCKLPQKGLHGAEPQPRSNLVRFSHKIWHLVAPILIIVTTSNWPNVVHVGQIRTKIFFPVHVNHSAFLLWKIIFLCHFLLVVFWNKASISNGFRDIQWRMWRNGWHDLKRPLNKGQCHLF